jgi:hypothetical protein
MLGDISVSEAVSMVHQALS